MFPGIDRNYNGGNVFKEIADDIDNPFASMVIMPHATPTMIKNGLVGQHPDSGMRQALGVSTVVTSGTTTHPPLITSTVISSTPLVSGGISYEMSK